MSESDRVFQDFADAASWVSDVVHDIPTDRWAGAGLGDWDLRSLLGHTSRALLTARIALSTAADVAADTHAALANRADYFLSLAQLPDVTPAQVRERGVQAGLALGDDPAAAFDLLAESVPDEVKDSGNPIVVSIAGTIRLHDYLGTRVFELVVHGLDLCVALGQEAHVPSGPERAALELTSELAARGGHGTDLLLAATGRQPLPAGFSVLQPLRNLRPGEHA